MTNQSKADEIEDVQRKAGIRLYHHITQVGAGFYDLCKMANYLPDAHPTFVSEERREEVISYKGCKVLVVQVHETRERVSSDFVIVPGYVKSREGNVSQIAIIEDEKDRSELAKILEKHTRGCINFWSIDSCYPSFPKPKKI